MKYARYYLSLMFVAILVVAAASRYAFAQEADPGWFVGLRPQIEAFIGLLIAGMIAYLTSWLRAKWGLDIEKAHRDALQSALQNGSKLVLDRIIGKAATGATAETIKNAVPNDHDMRAGIEYVKNSVPDAVKHFDLSEENIKELLKPKVVVTEVLKRLPL